MRQAADILSSAPAMQIRYLGSYVSHGQGSEQQSYFLAITERTHAATIGTGGFLWRRTQFTRPQKPAV